MEASFQKGRETAEERSSGIDGRIKSGEGKNSVPQFQEGFKINPDETANAFEHSKKNESAKAVNEVHKKRGIYKFDENDPIVNKSERLHKDPKKHLNEIETVAAGQKDYTIEYCEECSEEEYHVTARKEKKRYVYLQTPPYITANQTCENHGQLSIKVELINEPEEVFREDGQFLNLHHVSTNQWGGAYVDETYSVNGANVTLRKTIFQNGSPWIHPDCYLVSALQGNVVNSEGLILKLLGGANDEYIGWGEIGSAYLHHRVVNDTGEHYWILDDKCQEYEKLVEQGFCRYHSMMEDPPSDKYWKGKKVSGSWGQTVTYACMRSCKNTCSKLKAKGCEQIGSECVETVGSHCVRWKQKFRCVDKTRTDRHTFTGDTAFCLDGNCIDSSYKSDQDMIEALGYLSILENVRKELNGTGNIEIFKGKPYSCTRWLLSFKDCCGCGGWGVNWNMTSCDEDSKQVAKLRNEGKCIRVGTYCAERLPILKTCVRKKTIFCCFGNRFAKLLQEQGKSQLGQDFGYPESPNCRGFTVEELSRIDFSKLDLTEISQEVMESFKPQDIGKHFAKGDELQRIRESMKDLPMMKNAGNREGNYLNENMKHLTGSATVKK